MSNPLDAQLAQEIARAALQYAALQYAAVAAEIPSGNATQELLRARQRALEAAAGAYCAAYDHAAPEVESQRGEV